MQSPFFVGFAKDFTTSPSQYVIIRYIINQSANELFGFNLFLYW